MKQHAKIETSTSSGPVIYKDYQDNFVIWPGTESKLKEFVNQPYGGKRHKLKPTKSSNSEDALTWSCLEILNHFAAEPRKNALSNLWALAYGGLQAPESFLSGEVIIGKKYGVKGEETEVDASIEGDGILVFIEAKLYSPMSIAEPEKGKPHDQIARKLRVGIKEAQHSGRSFYFIILDIAPKEKLLEIKSGASLKEANQKLGSGFARKWQTAYWFRRYKGSKKSVTPLRKVLADIPDIDAKAVANNMGWLTWSDVFKTVLRGLMQSHFVR
ncbi:MAG: hypothetical protein WCH99_10415 [Verrucomicrobiota bacterium]